MYISDINTFFKIMSLYTLYTFQFSPLFSEYQGSLFEEYALPSDEYAMDNKNKALHDILNGNIAFKYGNKHLSMFPISNEDDIIIFKIANKKTLILEKDFKPSLVINEPSVYVIIHNSPEVQRIAIEQNKSIFSDTKVVASIIQRSLLQYLKGYNLSISIKREFQVSEFWDIANRYKGSISMIRFQFEYPNLPRARDNASKMLKELSIDTNSRTSKIELCADENATLLIDPENEELNGLAKASAETGNNVIFKAKKIRSQIRTGNTTRTLIIEDVETSDISELKKLLEEQ